MEGLFLVHGCPVDLLTSVLYQKTYGNLRTAAKLLWLDSGDEQAFHYRCRECAQSSSRFLVRYIIALGDGKRTKLHAAASPRAG